MQGFRTIAVSLAVIVLGLLEQINVADFIPDQYDGLAIAVVGAVMAGLRLVTKSPVGKKPE